MSSGCFHWQKRGTSTVGYIGWLFPKKRGTSTVGNIGWLFPKKLSTTVKINHLWPETIGPSNGSFQLLRLCAPLHRVFSLSVQAESEQEKQKPLC